MARNVQLQELVAQLRTETRQSASVAHGTDRIEHLKQALRRTQEQLYDDHDWPFLRVDTTIDLVATSRYYDMPDELNVERIEQVRFIWGDQYCSVARGIEFEDYNEHDSNADTPETSDPVLKWDIRSTAAGVEQIEVWPVPATDGTLYMRGIRKLPALTSDSDTAVLDDRLIVLFAAAGFMKDKKDIDRLNGLASARLAKLKGRLQGASKPFRLGSGDPYERPRRGTVIRIAGT